MIKIEDKIKYLPNSPSSEIIDTNAVLNASIKALYQEIEKSVLSLDCKGEDVLVEVVGDVSNNNIDVIVNGSEEMKLKVKNALNPSS